MAIIIVIAGGRCVCSFEIETAQNLVHICKQFRPDPHENVMF